MSYFDVNHFNDNHVSSAFLSTFLSNFSFSLTGYLADFWNLSSCKSDFILLGAAGSFSCDDNSGLSSSEEDSNFLGDDDLTGDFSSVDGVDFERDFAGEFD